jgi:hypothetical protein
MSALSTPLDQIAGRIRQEHAAAGVSAKKALEHALAAGELLIEAKGQVKHGQWLPWLSANCELSERTAQAYMRLAKMKSATVADLPLREALKAIAAPKIRYVFDCGCSASCNCGVDYVLRNENGEVVARKSVHLAEVSRAKA